MYLSPSLIKTYEICKLQYKWRYVDRIEKPQPETDALVFGSYVHRFMELYEHKKVSDILQQLKREFNVPKRMESNLIVAIGNTVKYIKQYEDYKGENEQKIKANIGSLYLAGKSDKIYTTDEGLIIVDFKTSKKFWKGMNDLQLKFYSLVLSKERNIPPEQIETIVYYSFLGSIDSNTYTSDEIDYFLEYLKDVAGRINKTRSWTPTKNRLCDFCAYKEDCPAWD